MEQGIMRRRDNGYAAKGKLRKGVVTDVTRGRCQKRKIQHAVAGEL